MGGKGSGKKKKAESTDLGNLTTLAAAAASPAQRKSSRRGTRASAQTAGGAKPASAAGRKRHRADDDDREGGQDASSEEPDVSDGDDDYRPDAAHEEESEDAPFRPPAKTAKTAQPLSRHPAQAVLVDEEVLARMARQMNDMHTAHCTQQGKSQATPKPVSQPAPAHEPKSSPYHSARMFNLIKALKDKMIRRKDITSACIVVNDDLEFLFRLVETSMKADNVIKLYQLQAAAAAYRTAPESLREFWDHRQPLPLAKGEQHLMGGKQAMKDAVDNTTAAHAKNLKKTFFSRKGGPPFPGRLPRKTEDPRPYNERLVAFNNFCKTLATIGAPLAWLRKNELAVVDDEDFLLALAQEFDRDAVTGGTSQSGPLCPALDSKGRPRKPVFTVLQLAWGIAKLAKHIPDLFRTKEGVGAIDADTTQIIYWARVIVCEAAASSTLQDYTFSLPHVTLIYTPQCFEKVTRARESVPQIHLDEYEIMVMEDKQFQTAAEVAGPAGAPGMQAVGSGSKNSLVDLTNDDGPEAKKPTWTGEWTRQNVLSGQIPADADFTLPNSRMTISCMELQRMLSPTSWLSSHTFEVMCKLLQDREGLVQESKASTNYVFLNAYASKLLSTDRATSYQGSHAERVCKEMNLKSVILMPLNMGENHWVVIRACLYSGQMRAYDSLARFKEQQPTSEAREYARQLHDYMLKFSKWLEEHLPVLCQPPAFQIDTTMPSGLPQQENSYDCGVFAFKFMEELSCGKSPPEFGFCQADAPRIREHMFASVINGCLPAKARQIPLNKETDSDMLMQMFQQLGKDKMLALMRDAFARDSLKLDSQGNPFVGDSQAAGDQG